MPVLGWRIHTLSGITTILLISDPFFVLLDLQIFFCFSVVWVFGVTHVSMATHL